MGLETGTIISDLNPNNPTPQDKRRFGDDHLRLIKSTIKNTFANVKAAVTASDEELNFLVGVTSGIQAQLDAKLETADLDLTPYAKLAVAQSFTKSQRIVPKDHGNRSGPLIIDLDESDTHRVRATDNLTLTFSNLKEGQNITLKLIQGKTDGSAVITLPSEMVFPFGSTPTLVSVQNKYDVLAGKVIDGVVVTGQISDVS